jgi:hypothetical protein
MNYLMTFIAASAMTLSAHAAPVAPAPDLDLRIQYYSKVLTAEGVTREARYEENMLRRPGHVWVARVLPRDARDQRVKAPQAAVKKNVSLQVDASAHQHFNHVVTPRHISLENNQLRVEYFDAHDKNLIAIPASEYGNVNFDGSWENSFYLLDPHLLSSMKVSSRVSKVPGAQWHEREKNGVFQRVLWDAQRQIPLVIESGDKAATFFQRVEVKPLATLSTKLPWNSISGYARKEYADFLD